MEKLILAQDTSNIDDTDISTEELRELGKKRRRVKATKKFSSSSEDEDFVISDNKENNLTQIKKLPTFPQFVPIVNRQNDKQPQIDKCIYNFENVLPDKTLIITANKNGEQYHYKS